VLITFNASVLEKCPNTTGSHSEGAVGQYGLSQSKSSLLLNRGGPTASSVGGKTPPLRFLLGHWTEWVLWMVQKAREMAPGRGSECREKEARGLAAVTFLSCIVKPYP